MADKPDPFEEVVEVHSKTWRLVKEAAGREVTEAIAMLVTSGLSEAKSEYERGRIAAAHAILGLGESKPHVPAPAPY